MRHCGWLLGLLSLFSLATHASDWQEIKNEAKGQTVWFNAWGGDTAINRYLDWVSGEMKTHYAINLKIVRLADAADAVKRIQTEVAAGRKTGGSVDLLWVNGENFRTLKEANLLQTGWAETLPNWRYVDTQLPVREDFSVPTEGAESPWGGAQLTFIARRDVTLQPPQTPQALLEFAKANPGTVTYPRPPDFTGTAFLEQLLIMLTPDPTALKEAPDDATFARVTAPLWQYLDALHPYLWREGKDFPPSPARMDALLKANTLRLSLTFNPAHAQQKIASGDLPASELSAPVADVVCANHFVTEELQSTNCCVTNNGRAQVTDMHLFRHVWRRVVNHNGLFFWRSNTETIGRQRLLNMFSQECRIKENVDKAWTGDLNFAGDTVKIQMSQHLLC